MLSVFYQIVYWLENLMGLILTVRMESIKNVKFSPCQNSRYTVCVGGKDGTVTTLESNPAISYLVK